MNILQRTQPTVSPVEKVVIPEASMITLENGIPVYLIESGTQEIMRLEFTFRAGQIKETIPLLSSTANLMLTEGSKNYTSEEFNNLMDFYGAFYNLYSDKDSAGIVVYCLNRQIEKILELAREILFFPMFPENELNALMKKRLQRFLVNREKPQYRSTEQFFESIFGNNHPYGYRINEKDFELMNTPLLADFHSKYYRPDNLAVIISGKIHKRTKELLNNYLGDLKSVNSENDTSEPLPSGENLKKIHINMPETVQTSVRIGSPTINKRHEDYPGLKFLDSLLGGYFGSRLMKNIREEKGYTYGIHSSVSSLNHSGYKIISTEVSSKNLHNAIDEIYKEISLLQNVPVDNNEMSIVRNYMSGEMVRMFDGPFALAESFKSAWEFGLDNSYYHKLAKKINTIEPDEIISLARTYYKIEDLYEITVGIK